MTRRPPRSPHFPYTTLFRSVHLGAYGRGMSAYGLAFARIDDIASCGAQPAGTPVPADAQARTEPSDGPATAAGAGAKDRKSTRLNSSHSSISYAVFCLKKKK